MRQYELISKTVSYSHCFDVEPGIDFKPRPNALDFSLYVARQMSSIVECCREGVAKRSRLFTRLGTQHSTDVVFDEEFFYGMLCSLLNELQLRMRTLDNARQFCA